MSWYIFFLFLTTLWLFFSIFALFKFKKHKNEGFVEYLLDNKVFLIKIWAVSLIVVTVLLSKQLWRTTTCQFDGLAANTETSYSWYKGQCLYKSKTGAWLPLGISRDQPEGSDHGN